MCFTIYQRLTQIQLFHSTFLSMIGFVDWYSGWPEAFADPDKTADTVIHLLLLEVLPRYSTPLQIVTDNSENISRVMKHAL